jgi:NAD(P)-dependent dehydrogenase (short-subunit alcohol dehydrogenase family)
MNDPRSKMDLSGRTALITGAAGGLGSVFSKSLASLGAKLILVDIDEKKLNLIAAEIRSLVNVEITLVECDLEKENDRTELISNVLKSNTYLNILVNNAAFVGSSDLTGWAEPFHLQSLETWNRALEVNLTACFHLIQGLAPLMKKSKGANIVNISSIYGHLAPDWSLYEGTSMSNPAAYATSKGGLIQFTRWLASTLAPEIRVNAISPGGVLRDQLELFVNRYESKVPLKRMAHADDIVGALSYLASDLSSYVTGTNLEVDGGWGIL